MGGLWVIDANGNIQSAKRWDNAGTQYDDLKYNYEKSGTQLRRNRLYHLNETKYGGYDDIDIDISEYHNDHEDVNLLNNYRYDALGNLIQDKREEIANIEWTVSGKVKRITRTADSTKPPLEFAYGADGQRISKTVGDPLNGGYREYYLRDAQGNIMAMYRHTNTGPKSLKVTERPVYGSSRIGSYTGQMELAGEQAITSYPYTQPMSEFLKRYELTDHLGNVATVVTGRLLDGAGAGSAKQAEVVSAQGYEAFGSLLPGRNYSSANYRFGFNGKENDNDVYGATGTFQDYGMRAYDTRVGRLISIDPYTFKYPWYTPYQFAGNSPIRNVDQLGLQPASAIEKWDWSKPYTYEGTRITIHKVEGFWVYEKQSNTSNEKMNTWIWWNEKDYAWQEFIPVTQERLDHENVEATGRSIDHIEKGILGLAVTGSTLGLGSIPAVSNTVSSLFTATLRQRFIAGGVNLATQSVFNDRPMELDLNGFAASVATGNPVLGSAWASLGTLTVESGWTTNNAETALPQFVMGTIGGIVAGNAASSVWKDLAKTSPAGSLIGEVATGMLGSTAVTGIAKTEAEETKR